MAKRIPKQERSRKKYDAIIRGTRQVLSRCDYSEISTAQIAKEAGVGIGTVYEYFENKEDIIGVILETEMHAIWDRAQQQIPLWASLPTDDAIESVIRFAVDAAGQQTDIVPALLGNLEGLLQMPSVVRFVEHFEIMVRVVFLRSEQPPAESTVHEDAFILTHAVGGVLLGVGAGLPANIDEEKLIQQTVRFVHAIVHKD